MPAFNGLSPTTLMRLIGGPDAPVLVDVSIDPDFDEDPFLVPTAFRHPHKDMAGLMDRIGDRPSLIICQKGAKLSHGVAARLRAQGLTSQNLTGGNYGWRDAGLPRVNTAAFAGIEKGASLWVTRHRPKIDRIACPWLIRRFVDPNAEFLFVPPADVQGVAERFDAVPFDIADTHWSHRGEQCTFDTMIAEFGLSHEPLDRLATIVRAADTDQHNLAPQAAGLLAVSIGLGRMFKDDMQQLNNGMLIYDALYRWARDGFSETHDWVPNT